ncbi:hypothetical protein QCA50_015233 [Cerrena zonata]|uniref:2OGFeDO JBP1/TET oxygenase domain-containing protein n=1 Tax=Cerrena zonata TaxID=2478898 RepID=A0AAW0FLJ2_9APHY
MDDTGPNSFQMMHQTSTYMLQCYTTLLHATTHGDDYHRPGKPSHLSEEFTADCHSVISMMVRAFLNPVPTTWDVANYCHDLAQIGTSLGRKGKKEAKLWKRYPWVDSCIRSISSARTVVDCYGRIMTWILPDILPVRMQEMLYNATVDINNDLAGGPDVKNPGCSWRLDPSLFTRTSDNDPIGVLNFSPAWFMNGWEGKHEGLATSPFLRSPRGRQWVQGVSEVGMLLSGVLRIMHPDQYRMMYETQKAIATDSRFEASISNWPFIFNATTIVANRRCRLHRDTRGSMQLFDLLVSVGRYQNAPFFLHPAGLQIPNSPGTIVAFSGKAFPHGVAKANGSRVCHAFYMRQSLQIFTKVRPSEWMKQEVYRQWVGPVQSDRLRDMHTNPFELL